MVTSLGKKMLKGKKAPPTKAKTGKKKEKKKGQRKSGQNAVFVKKQTPPKSLQVKKIVAKNRLQPRTNRRTAWLTCRKAWRSAAKNGNEQRTSKGEKSSSAHYDPNSKRGGIDSLDGKREGAGSVL